MRICFTADSLMQRARELLVVCFTSEVSMVNEVCSHSHRPPPARGSRIDRYAFACRMRMERDPYRCDLTAMARSCALKLDLICFFK